MTYAPANWLRRLRRNASLQPARFSLIESDSLDAARNRKDHGPANIAILRRRALDLARRDTSKESLSIKLKRAGWSDAFLLNLLKRLAKEIGRAHV